MISLQFLNYETLSMAKQTNRRKFINRAILTSAAAITPKLSFGQERFRRQELKTAGYEYDRCKAIADGSLGVKDYTVTFHPKNIYEMNDLAFGKHPVYQITEIGLIPFINKYINEGFRGYTLIPVFISRSFRHRNIFVHADSGINTPEDLKGKRVGTPGYGMSSNTWIRGMLLDEYGVKADDFTWIETTKSSDVGKISGAGTNAFTDKGNLFPFRLNKDQQMWMNLIYYCKENVMRSSRRSTLKLMSKVTPRSGGYSLT